MQKKILFIINPAAASGALKSAWGGLADGLKGNIRHFDAAFTRRAGDATKITREGLRKYKMIVAVGGDGTLNECVNGFFDKGKQISCDAVLGILPFGRGSDFARGLGIPSDPLVAMKRLGGDVVKRVDVGLCTYSESSGKTKSRYFLNVANVGIVPHVVGHSRKAPRLIGGTGAYMYGALRGMVAYKAPKIVFSGRGREEEVSLLNMAIANGKYFGAGMRIAPQARVDDGLFEVIVAGKMKLREFLFNMPGLYSGRHTKLKNVSYFRSDQIQVRSIDKRTPVLVEMDGEMVGRLPATFKIIPKAISFKV